MKAFCKRTAGWLILWIPLVICAEEQTAPDWRQLGVDAEPQLIVFSKEVFPPAGRYFIPERMITEGIVAQYENKAQIESLRLSLRVGRPSLYTVSCFGFIHVYTGGTWKTWPLVTDQNCSMVGAEVGEGRGAQVIDLPPEIVPLLQDPAIIPDGLLVSANVLAPPTPGFSTVKITDPARLNSPVGLGSLPEESSRKMATPVDGFDPDSVLLKVYVPNGYRDDVPHGLMINQYSYRDVAKESWAPWPTSEFDKRRLIYVIVGANQDDRGKGYPSLLSMRMLQEARKFACRNFHISPGRCYMVQHQSAALFNVAAYPEEFDGCLQFGWKYGVTQFSTATGKATVIKDRLPEASLDILRKRGHRMALYCAGLNPNGLPDPKVTAETTCLVSEGLAVKYLPSGGASSNELLLQQALDHMERHRPPLAQDQLAPEVGRVMDWLEKNAVASPEAARAAAMKMWSRYPSSRNHARFQAVLEILEALPAVAH